MNSFFYPSVVKVVTTLKDKDNTVHGCVKSCKLFWMQVKNAFNLLYMYGFLERDGKIGMPKYHLTEDGIKLRDSLCTAYSLVNQNREELQSQMMGYKTRGELIDDVKKDILSNKGISATTTTPT